MTGGNDAVSLVSVSTTSRSSLIGIRKSKTSALIEISSDCFVQFHQTVAIKLRHYGKAYKQELFRNYFGREVHYRTNQISKALTNKSTALPTVAIILIRGCCPAQLPEFRATGARKMRQVGSRPMRREYLIGRCVLEV